MDNHTTTHNQLEEKSDHQLKNNHSDKYRIYLHQGPMLQALKINLTRTNTYTIVATNENLSNRTIFLFKSK